MKISFKRKKDKKCYESSREAQTAFGKDVALVYIQRIDILQAIHRIEDLEKFPPLGFHALKGNLKGKYSIKLTGFYRLIFSLKGEMGETIFIEEVSKHYGD